MLFSTAVFSSLDVDGHVLEADFFQVERSDDAGALAKPLAERFDRLVLLFANAYRPSFVKHLDRWSEVLERTELSVSVIGIGGQFSLEQSVPRTASDVDDAAKRFVRAALERGPSGGVRGAVTADYVRSLGFPPVAIDVIGCPSLYRPDVSVRMQRRAENLEPGARIAVNLTRFFPRARTWIPRCWRRS